MNALLSGLDEKTAKLKQRISKSSTDLDQIAKLGPCLSTLPSRISHEIMVPFGSKAFFPGRLVHTNEVFCCLGAETFAWRTVEQAKEIATRKEQAMTKQLETLEVELAALQEQRNALTTFSQLNKMQQENDTVDIVEYEDSPSFPSSSSQHSKPQPQQALPQSPPPRRAEVTIVTSANHHHHKLPPLDSDQCNEITKHNTTLNAVTSSSVLPIRKTHHNSKNRAKSKPTSPKSNKPPSPKLTGKSFPPPSPLGTDDVELPPLLPLPPPARPGPAPVSKRNPATPNSPADIFEHMTLVRSQNSWNTAVANTKKQVWFAPKPQKFSKSQRPPPSRNIRSPLSPIIRPSPPHGPSDPLSPLDIDTISIGPTSAQPRYDEDKQKVSPKDQPPLTKKQTESPIAPSTQRSLISPPQIPHERTLTTSKGEAAFSGVIHEHPTQIQIQEPPALTSKPARQSKFKAERATHHQ
eukprot:c5809_g1_i1.p1 GENE.c5809_g1_i1~~c5809_g1_i1.p1  ORF type:complete len:476 (-),score=99.95 c5809_g1_i1:25-1419(-)